MGPAGEGEEEGGGGRVVGGGGVSVKGGGGQLLLRLFRTRTPPLRPDPPPRRRLLLRILPSTLTPLLPLCPRHCAVEEHGWVGGRGRLAAVLCAQCFAEADGSGGACACVAALCGCGVVEDALDEAGEVDGVGWFGAGEEALDGGALLCRRLAALVEGGGHEGAPVGRDGGRCGGRGRGGVRGELRSGLTLHGGEGGEGKGECGRGARYRSMRSGLWAGKERRC